MCHMPTLHERKPRNSTEDRSPPVVQSIIMLWAYRKALEMYHKKNWAAHSHITQQEMKTKKISSQFKVITAPDRKKPNQKIRRTTNK